MDENVAMAMAENGNETEDIWLNEFQRISGQDAVLSDEAQTRLHTLRMARYALTTDSAQEWLYLTMPPRLLTIETCGDCRHFAAGPRKHGHVLWTCAVSEYRSRVSRPPIPLWCPLPKAMPDVMPEAALDDDDDGGGNLVIAWALLEQLKDD